jgi:hypothetical protein
VTVARHGDGRRTAGTSWAAASTQQHSCDAQRRGSTANGCYGAKCKRGWACCAQGLGLPARGRCCYADVAARRSRARARGVCMPGHRFAARAIRDGKEAAARWVCWTRSWAGGYRDCRCARCRRGTAEARRIYTAGEERENGGVLASAAYREALRG